MTKDPGIKVLDPRTGNFIRFAPSCWDQHYLELGYAIVYL